MTTSKRVPKPEDLIESMRKINGPLTDTVSDAIDANTEASIALHHAQDDYHRAGRIFAAQAKRLIQRELRRAGCTRFSVGHAHIDGLDGFAIIHGRKPERRVRPYLKATVICCGASIETKWGYHGDDKSLEWLAESIAAWARQIAATAKAWEAAAESYPVRPGRRVER